MDTYLVTGNHGKYQETKLLIPRLQKLELEDLPEIQSLDIEEIIKAKTLAAVERLQLKECYLIVEDTGLYLDALNGFPGPLIKFMLKSIGTENIFKVCQAFGIYGAHAVTDYGLYDPASQRFEFFRGESAGTIIAPRGSNGFGWDDIFIPEGSNKTFAEVVSAEEKAKYSMRGAALGKLAGWRRKNND